MKKKYKWIVCILLFITLMLPLPMDRFVADETMQDFSDVEIPTIAMDSDIFATYADGSEVVAAFRATNHGFVALSKSEYATYIEEAILAQAQKTASLPLYALANNSIDAMAQVPNFTGASYTWYKEIGYLGSASHTGLWSRVSSYYKNSTTNDMTFTFSTSYTQSPACPIPLSHADKRAIFKMVGMPFTSSSMAQQSIEATVAPSYTGWVDFYPTMYNTWGQLFTAKRTNPATDTTNRFVDVYFPKLLSIDLLDGIYEVKQRKATQRGELTGWIRLADGFPIPFCSLSRYF